MVNNKKILGDLKKSNNNQLGYELLKILEKQGITTNDPRIKENNKIDSLEVDREFVVMREPTSAVISADNMRVFYRKLQNPTSISIPGVAFAFGNRICT